MDYATIEEAWGVTPPLTAHIKKKKKGTKLLSAAAACRAGPPPVPEFKQKEPACGLLNPSQPNDEEDILNAYYSDHTTAAPFVPQTPAYPTHERMPRQDSRAAAAAPSANACAMPPDYMPRGVEEIEEDFYEYAKFYDDELDWIGGRDAQAPAPALSYADAPTPAPALSYADDAPAAPSPAPYEDHEEGTLEEYHDGGGSAPSYRYRASSSGGSARQNMADIALYILSGVMLIFIMEQFLKLGMTMRNFVN